MKKRQNRSAGPSALQIAISIALLSIAATTTGLARTEPATQSVSFTGSGAWTPGTTVQLSLNLTFSGYNALGLSYWLEVPNALAPFLSITNASYFTFTDPNNAFGFPITFTDSAGARTGYMTTNRDLGATTNPGTGIAPGTYPVTTLTFSLASGLPPGIYTIFTSSLPPRMSEVTDSNFIDNNIIPPGQFVVVIPEPSTFSLLALAAVGLGLLTRRSRKVFGSSRRRCSTGRQDSDRRRFYNALAQRRERRSRATASLG